MTQAYARDTVNLILEEASNHFGDEFILDDQSVKELDSCWEIIDQIIEESYCESARILVDEDTMNVIVSLLSQDMLFEYGRTHPFFELIQHTSSFSFSQEKDMLKTDFVFSGLWCRQK